MRMPVSLLAALGTKTHKQTFTHLLLYPNYFDWLVELVRHPDNSLKSHADVMLTLRQARLFHLFSSNYFVFYVGDLFG